MKEIFTWLFKSKIKSIGVFKKENSGVRRLKILTYQIWKISSKLFRFLKLLSYLRTLNLRRYHIKVRWDKSSLKMNISLIVR